MNSDKDDSQAENKQEIREWLKKHDLSFKWLASWLNRSEGTIKNWLYGTVRISEKNLESIQNIRQRYEAAKLTNNLNPKYYKEREESDDFMNFAFPYSIGFFLNEKDAGLVSKSVRANTESCFYNPSQQRCANGPTSSCVRLITDVLNERIKNTLLNLKEKYEAEGKQFSALTIPQAQRTQMDEEFSQTEDVWIIQVANSFNLDYACMAAKEEGFDSLNEWLNVVLREIAIQKIEDELEDFLA